MSQKLYNMDIRLRFKSRKKLNVGGSYSVKSRADIPFQRITMGGITYFYIPGSTFKGVLRTALIKISGLLGYDIHSWRVNPDVLTELDDIVVRLFGGPHDKPSKIYVKPAYIPCTSKTLTHVSIDDKLGISKKGALYTVEYIPIGIEFGTTIYARGISIEEARALYMAIAELRFERIGKAGILDVWIVRDESRIPGEIAQDEVIGMVLEVLGI